jgi:3'(2'), 5'-bisphosphate nucleotidase
VIAEEEVAAGRIPAHGDTYFLVDPLDGTKEFVRGGDDYTVNIGLIVNGTPHVGAVFAPATERLHAGVVGEGAWLEDLSNRIPISTRKPGSELVAVASKSHFKPADRRLSLRGREELRLRRHRLLAEVLHRR